MRKYLKIAVFSLAAVGFSSARAGAYEDFFRAVQLDDPRVVAELLQRGFDPNTPSPEGIDGLYLALQHGSLRVARLLVDHPKGKVETRTPADESPLMMAALKGHTELAKRLIARDADVNKPGWTPLHYAATGGHVEIIELLLEHHAFIDAQSPNGTTPLMMAAHYGTPEAVRVLLQAGADIHMKNQLGMTALDFARRGSRPDAITLLTEAMRAKPAAPAGTGRW